MKASIVALGAIAVCLALAVGPVSAGDPPLAYGAYGYTAPPLGYYYVTVPDKIPYFAQSPPVYYSHIVPRAYGWTPYPYPPAYPMPKMQPAPEMEAAPPAPEASGFVPRRQASLSYTYRMR